MFGMMRKIGDKLFARGEYSVSIPAMDGALQTNSFIEEATCLAVGEEVDNICLCKGNMYFSDAKQLYRLDVNEAIAVGDAFKSNIIAIAAHDENIVIVTADGLFFMGKPNRATLLKGVSEDVGKFITAIDFLDKKTLVFCVGSNKNTPDCWTKDLLEHNKLGSVCALDIETGKVNVWAKNMSYPAGVIVCRGRVIVSESWRHRLVEVLANGELKVVLAHLPGYPGRLARDGQNGAILSVFAPRSQLIELVLREHTYRKRMMREVPKHLWVAPALSSGKSFLEPMQSGAVKIMGILKPWAPSRSYGLVVRLDENYQPTESFHSRADGHRHGITSAIQDNGSLIMTSRGAGEILKMDISKEAALS